MNKYRRPGELSGRVQQPVDVQWQVESSRIPTLYYKPHGYPPSRQNKMSILQEIITLIQTGTSQPRLVLAAFILSTLILSRFFKPSTPQPPSIPELIPRISNTVLFFNHYSGLLRRAKTAFGSGDIVRFYVGHKTVYLVRGARNITRLLRTSNALSSEGFVLLVLKGMARMTSADLEKFVSDKSGRLKTPIPGTEGTHPRYWADNHALYADYLTPAYYTDVLAQKYFAELQRRLDLLPLPFPPSLSSNPYDDNKIENESENESLEIQLKPFLRQLISESSLLSIFGPSLLQLTPEIVEQYWEFDRLVNPILFGAPRWLFPASYTAQETFYAGVEKWLDHALANFDWADETANTADWEPLFGARVTREAASWLTKGGFTKQATVGLLGGLVFALLANTVSVVTWAVMHLLQNPNLLARAREEAKRALVFDDEQYRVDRAKLMGMPLLQAIFAETLRLHVIFPVMREVMEPVEFAGYKIAKGSYIQGAGGIEHFDDASWAKDGHGADEFWPERFLVHAEGGNEVPVFSTEGKNGKFFPFGKSKQSH